MFKAVCTECGDPCEVPFRPTGDKPVLCSNCFGQDSRAKDKKSDSGPSNEKLEQQLKNINQKLDEILKNFPKAEVKKLIVDKPVKIEKELKVEAKEKKASKVTKAPKAIKKAKIAKKASK
jgi:CxxC-x17-CxxC domain-containing protein